MTYRITPCIRETVFDERDVPRMRLNLPYGLEALVPRFAAELLTEASHVKTSIPKILALNELYRDQGRNVELENWTEFAIQYAAMIALNKDRPEDILAYMNEAVAAALNCFGSLLARDDRDIYDDLSHQERRAVSANVERYSEVSRELKRISYRYYEDFRPDEPRRNSPISSNYRPQYGSGRGRDREEERQSSVRSRWDDRGGSSDSNRMASSFGRAKKVPESREREERSPLRQGAWFDDNERKEVREVNNFSRGSFGITEEEYEQPKEVKQPEVVLDVVETKEVLTVNKGHEMELERHAIPYFGDPELTMDLSQNNHDFRIDTLQLSKGASEDVLDGLKIFFEPVQGVELSIDSAIFNTRYINTTKQPGGKKAAVFRNFYSILQAFPTIPSAKAVSKTFECNGDYKLLINRLKAVLKSLNNPHKPNEEDIHILNFISFLDRKLAEAVNDFLKYRAKLGVLVGSFCEDYEDLLDHLEANNVFVKEHLEVFMTNLLESAAKGYTDKSEEFFANYLDSNQEFSVGYFPQTNSITLIELTSQELCFTFKGEFASVDPKTTPTIYELCKSLKEQKRTHGIFTTKDYFVTASDQRFLVVEELGSSTFQIFKA